MKKKINTNSLKIQYVATSSLHPAPYNPRYWDETDKSTLKESILRFGVTEPLLVNSYPKRKNRIISGHFRWNMAKELNIKTLPIIYLYIPSLEKERELCLRMNRNQGKWDTNLLKEFEIGALLNIGFDDADLASIWDDALETEDDNFQTEKEIKKIKSTDIRPGDIYQLGQHRLACADSTDLNAIKKLVGKEKIQMIYCDPVYNISLNYDTGIGNKGRYGGKTDDNKPDEEYKEFLKKTLENGLSVAQHDCHAFYWCDERYIGLLQELYKELGLDNKRVCLWIKGNQNPTPQVAFNKFYEPIVYATRGTPYLSPNVKNLNEALNKEISTGNQAIYDIIDLFNIWLVKRLPGNQYEHPTEKPPTLHEKPLRRCTKIGDAVLDMFGGGGSTLIACEQLKRRAYLSEIEPIFCQLIINRYEQLTKRKAKKLN